MSEPSNRPNSYLPVPDKNTKKLRTIISQLDKSVIDKLRNANNSKQSQCSRHSCKLMNKEITDLNSQVSACQEENLAIKIELESKTKIISAKDYEFNNLLNSIAFLDQKLGDSENEISKMTKNMQELKTENSKLNTEVMQLKNDLQISKNEKTYKAQKFKKYEKAKTVFPVPTSNFVFEEEADRYKSICHIEKEAKRLLRFEEIEFLEYRQIVQEPCLYESKLFEYAESGEDYIAAVNKSVEFCRKPYLRIDSEPEDKKIAKLIRKSAENVLS